MKARVILSRRIVDVIEYHDENEPMFQYKEHNLYGSNEKFQRKELQFIDENDWDSFLNDKSSRILAEMIGAQVAKNGEIDLNEETVEKYARAAVKYTKALIEELKKRYK